MSLPNFISLGRLLAVPVAVWLILSGKFGFAFWVFIAAGISDAVDGFLAKRMNAQTELGKVLDPLADKALLVAVYVTLGQAGHLPVWLVILVVFRDLLIVGGIILSHTLGRPVRMRPLLVSKLNTGAQIVLAGGILAVLGLGLRVDQLILPMVWLVAATTAVSGGAYLVTWARFVTSAGDGN
ncbi:CDP-alcohol phosphatidyltransferase family protein [Shumkonia mesophila]|uniref:CDP-alcohol phosphatidyltransferase family protein n=1 Tax=Shumkonia mesophila TaxID=2838854 RepID=UPI0029345EF0|nr:CDP-alcohol phosphatidyltransferase family protein [Shumkonia mesophila]